MSRSFTAVDDWVNASVADEHAYALQDQAHRTPPVSKRIIFARRANEAADAFEVAADAWEVVGDEVKAEIRRKHATLHRANAFKAAHEHLAYGWYIVSDKEARELARKNNVPLPKPGHGVARVLLDFTGPSVELQRVGMNVQWLAREKRKRPWVWAVGGLL